MRIKFWTVIFKVKIKIKELLLFAIGGVAIYGTAAFYFSAIEASSASTAVVLMYTAPVIVMVFSVAFLGERFNVAKLISVVLVSQLLVILF